MKSVAEILAINLRKWGVNCVFGIPGKPVVPLIMALDKQDVNFILAKHENGAGYAAAGYSLLSQNIGVAIGTSGPGGTNLLTSAGQAKAYHIPVLFITGQQPMNDVGKALGQDSTIFGTDLVKMFEPVTKFSARVERGEQFERYLAHALEKAYFGVRGPVHLSIPSDVLVEEIEAFEIELPKSLDRMRSSKIDEFIEKLNSAKRPVILGGKGVHSSSAYDELKELSETWEIPVMTTPGGKGVFIENHPLSLGGLGLGGTERASEYVKQGIDLMIVIGSKLSDMSLVDIQEEDYPKEVIHLDYDPTFIGKSLTVNTLPIIGDIKTNLQAVLNKVKDKERKQYELLQEEYYFENEGEYLSAAYAMKIVRRILPDDTIVFGDDGSHSFYAINNFNIRKPGTFFFDDVFGAMGHAIGYSVGAQLADYNSKIVCLSGDGCTFMQGTEMSTALNYNLPVTFIVLNNGRLDMVDKGMERHLGKAVGTRYNVPLDIKRFGESMGIKSYRCTNSFELEQALEVSNTHRETIIIEIMVDPNEIPPTMKRG
ncbi:thiamine pyrophosphate-binding protein [Clostridium intestinale]|uniref:thiamine pyrophosphate-binding protein n=1 Tax=Clostridium intestinale TaxID=36845 RepID=UPI0028F01C12|nr:thiamine pyrophosphate-binding protein [Clostridium intestinale]